MLLVYGWTSALWLHPSLEKIMKKFIFWLKKIFSLKPKNKLETGEIPKLTREVRLKMFSQGNLGLAILFILLEEIGKGESLRNNQGPDVARYKQGHGGLGAWCAALICYGAEQALTILNSLLAFKRTHGARKLFYEVFGDDLGGTLTNVPAVGHLVLFDRGTEEWTKHIGCVSRVLVDKYGNILKWWYIAGNEGRFPAKTRESRGDNKKKLESFMDISTIKVE